jgi:hypothetical protein
MHCYVVYVLGQCSTRGAVTCATRSASSIQRRVGLEQADDDDDAMDGGGRASILDEVRR